MENPNLKNLSETPDPYQIDLANGTIRLCPHCGAPGVLASGCNYIKCPMLDCQKEWCWLCRNPKFTPAAGLPACNDPTHNSHSPNPQTGNSN